MFIRQRLRGSPVVEERSGASSGLLPPVLVRLVQPASSAGASSGRLRESAFSVSMCGCCGLWRLALENIPLWSTADPPPSPPAVIIVSAGAVAECALFRSHAQRPHRLIAGEPPRGRGVLRRSRGSDGRGGRNSRRCSHGPKQRKKLVRVARAQRLLLTLTTTRTSKRSSTGGRGDLREPLRSARSNTTPADLRGMSSCSCPTRIHANVSYFDCLIPSLESSEAPPAHTPVHPSIPLAIVSFRASSKEALWFGKLVRICKFSPKL